MKVLSAENSTGFPRPLLYLAHLPINTDHDKSFQTYLYYDKPPTFFSISRNDCPEQSPPSVLYTYTRASCRALLCSIVALANFCALAANYADAAYCSRYIELRLTVSHDDGRVSCLLRELRGGSDGVRFVRLRSFWDRLLLAL